ncbi:MAG: fatty acid desaturase [Pirellulales bacterium]
MISVDHAAVDLAEPVPPAGLRGALTEPKFAAGDAFHKEVRRRVEQYFQSTGRKQRDCPRMYFKTALVLGWFASSYALLVFWSANWWQAIPLAVSLALSMAAIGFNIQHDGGHGAYSNRPWVNRLMAMSLDMLGGSSYVWHCKHNQVHHSFANITGHDDDINLGLLGRLSPHQKRFNFHRWQHWYLAFLYGLLPIKWQFYDDFRDVLLGRVGAHRFPRPKGWNLAGFLAGKILFFSLALVVPLMLHSPGVVLAVYLCVSLVQGITLSIVFQLAHCVEEAAFPMPLADTGRMEAPWAVHQVQTTVDYARGNRLMSWFVGGLNFQIEHHLFPRICHLHYSALSPLVEQTCRDFGVRYAAHESFWSALTSHFRWLRRMGLPASDSPPAAPEAAI